MKIKAIMQVDAYSIREGELRLVTDNAGVRTILKDLTDTCFDKHGGYIKVELSPPYRQRSLGQNNLYWKRCTEYGKYLGMSKDEVSMGVKWRACDEGLWELVDIPFSHGKKAPKSTGESDVREMAILMEVLERIASEDGFVFEE